MYSRWSCRSRSTYSRTKSKALMVWILEKVSWLKPDIFAPMAAERLLLFCIRRRSRRDMSRLTGMPSMAKMAKLASWVRTTYRALRKRKTLMMRLGTKFSTPLEMFPASPPQRVSRSPVW